MLLQRHQSPDGIRVENNLRRHPEMAAILYDRAISIQENRWFQSRSHEGRVARHIMALSGASFWIVRFNSLAHAVIIS
jgi:hypothetical protein